MLHFHKINALPLNKQVKITFGTLLVQAHEYLKCIRNFANG